MEYLKEIISIVDKNKTKHIEIIGYDTDKEKKLYRLYDGILSGEYSSDVKACKELYQTNELDKGYRNLKSRLEKRVLNTLFFIDINSASFTDTQKSYYNCYKNLAAVKFLFVKNARKSGVKLAEKTLKQALQFEFHDVAIPLLKDLRLYYGTLLGDQRKMKMYNLQLRQLLEDVRYEERAREMYDTLASNFVKSKTIKPVHVEMAREYANELSKYSFTR